jgi:hypothetical protein
MAPARIRDSVDDDFTFRIAPDRAILSAWFGGVAVKLFDWLQQWQEGMGMGQAEVIRYGGRPARFRDTTRYRTLGRVAKVMIETRDTIPSDISWLLADAEDRILFVLPTATPEGKSLLARIGNRPGFDRNALRRAMKSTRNARFTVWRRARIEAGV